MDTAFIKNKAAKARIDDSITYIFALYKDARNNQSKSFQTETCRVIILYTISIIEALLHEAYAIVPEKITKEIYKDPRIIDGGYTHRANKDCSVVLNVRCTVEKPEREIQFNELLQFLKQKVLHPKTVQRLEKVNSLRNTFHLRKLGKSGCTTKDVEEALSLLDLMLNEIPKLLQK